LRSIESDVEVWLRLERLNPIAQLKARTTAHCLAGRRHWQGCCTSTTPEDLTGLLRLLAAESTRQTEAGKRLVIAIDEYEMLDQKIGSGTFTTDLLDTLRESMQTHRAITWILAGSHQVTDVQLRCDGPAYWRDEAAGHDESGADVHV
jgi:hypothetical protein